MLFDWNLLIRVLTTFRDMLNQTQEAVNSLNSSRTMLGIHTYSISSSVNSVSRQTISPSPLHGSLTLMSESHDLLLHHM